MRLIKITRTPTATLALFDTSSAYVIEAWPYAADTRVTLDEIEYRGNADRIATRAFALGRLASRAAAPDTLEAND